MSIDWTISPAAVWVLIGVLLILSEFALPGIIAVFFGVAAILVGLLLFLGVPLSLNAQLILFGVLAVALLVVARSRVKAWFQGRSEAMDDGVEVIPPGTSVTAVNDFVDGRGLVTHRGAHWNAEADEPVSGGQRLWILGRHGLVLRVSTRAPGAPSTPP